MFKVGGIFISRAKKPETHIIQYFGLTIKFTFTVLASLSKLDQNCFIYIMINEQDDHPAPIKRHVTKGALDLRRAWHSVCSARQ
jgi:hypothetical protein